MITIDVKKSNKLSEEFSCYVSFKYDPHIVQIMRELPQKSYNPENRQWEVPASKLEMLKEKLKEYKLNIMGNLDACIEKEVKIPDGFSFKTKPFQHQYEAFMYGLKNTKWFLGDEMGLGKTKQSLDIAIARKLEYEGDFYPHCLIVCGVNTLKWNWVNEIKTHTNENSWILGQKKLKNGTIKIGSTKDKLSDLLFIEKETTDETLPYFIITNVESFRDKQIAEQIKKLCDMNKIIMCIADEMHKMKNPQADQTKGFLKCQPKYRLGMTGTPLMNDPLDLYVILKWLGYETHAFYSFKKYYCIMGGFGGYEIIGYKNMEQLNAQIQDIMLRRKKEDVFDLPEKTYIDEYVDMLPKQAIVYKEVESDIKSHIDMIDMSNNPLASLIRLRQATGYPGILSSEIKDSAKLDRMEDIVEETIANGKKCIIFSNWTQMTDAIYERLSRYMPALITGETKDNVRQGLVEEFQTNKLSKIIIGTIGAMGTGLTLTAGTVVIFLDEPWNKALFEQAVDRAHRVGTTENVTIYSIMCKNTIDERIHDIIYKKGQLSDMIIDGHIVGDKAQIFNYLLG